MANHDVECPLCSGAANAQMPLLHTTVWQCGSRGCGLKFAHPQLSEEALASAYSNLYYPGRDAAKDPQFENTPKTTLRDFFTQLESRVGDLRGLRLLDYGCGRGALLEVAKEFGMQVTGIESDPQARLAASAIANVSIFSSIDQLQSERSNARFDVITLWTVIEHLRAPWAELARLRTVLQPAAWLLISTMDTDCLRARFERDKWENYENPTHLFYFDRVSLARTIRNAGFLDFSEWRLKLIYPQHGILRRWFYDFCFALRISDGLFFLCRQDNKDWEQTPHLSRETLGVSHESGHYSAVSRQSQMKSRS